MSRAKRFARLARGPPTCIRSGQQSSIGRRVSRAGRTGAALNLTPRALGWDRIHFAVRHLAAGASWSGLSARRGALPRPAARALRHQLEAPRIASARAPTSSTAIRTPSTSGPAPAFRIVAGGVRDRRLPRASRRQHSTPRVHPAGRLRLRNPRRRQRHAPDRRHHAAGVSRRSPAVCEVFTPGGNWSSYPPHKHDTDDPPREVDLEEIYYFRLQRTGRLRVPPRVQRTGATIPLRVTHGDVVAVRDGYHPFVTAYGYDAYYLNVLAGDRRSMAASDDPRYATLPARLAARPTRGCRWSRRRPAVAEPVQPSDRFR